MTDSRPGGGATGDERTADDTGTRPGRITGAGGAPNQGRAHGAARGLKPIDAGADPRGEPDGAPVGAHEEVDMSVHDVLERCTRQAAHRRDHDHGRREGACRPHAVEVVHLGRFAMVVCHDCGQDTGFGIALQAERTAAAHRARTGATDAPLHQG